MQLIATSEVPLLGMWERRNGSALPRCRGESHGPRSAEFPDRLHQDHRANHCRDRCRCTSLRDALAPQRPGAFATGQCHDRPVLSRHQRDRSLGGRSGLCVSFGMGNVPVPTLGAQVRKGRKAAVSFSTKSFRKKSDSACSEDEAESAPRLVARVSYVFNAAQVEGWEPPRSPRSNLVESIADAEICIQRLGADIRHGGEVARYLPVPDRIEIPPREAFVRTTYSSATEGYYSTLFHELTHWSGHGSRLKREFSQRFGNEAYAIEELVAELGAAFLCADFRISNAPRLDHAAYIASWLRVLGNDPRAIVTAASKALAGR